MPERPDANRVLPLAVHGPMASSRPQELEALHQPSAKRSPLTATGAARPLAPEDVQPGDFVVLFEESYEYPSFYWCADTTLLAPEEPVRIRFVPRDESLPLKVKGVCLPFVLVKTPRGGQRTLDLRQVRLARLDRAYAATAWKAYKKKPRPDTAAALFC